MFKYLWIITLGIADIIWATCSAIDGYKVIVRKKYKISDDTCAFICLHLAILILLTALSFVYFVTTTA